MLLADDLLVLELEEFPFLLEIGNDLSETLLKKFDLRLEQLDLLIFLKLLLCVLFHSLPLRH